MFENYSEAIQKMLKKENISTGQRVSVVSKEKRHEGFILPKSAGDPDVIVIKLDSGYNIGVEFGKGVKIMKRREKTELGKKKPAGKKYMPDPGKPSITVLHTGGTFASRVDYKTGAAYPALTPEEMFLAMPEAEKIANFNARVVFQMYSEDMEPEHWALLAKKISAELEETKPDGVIITHGTDTMAYTAAALSLMLQDLRVPVLMVGSQRSSDRASSDASMNLICAAQFIANSDFAGVAVCMHSSMSDESCHIIDGLHAKKMHTSRRDAFRSIDALPYASVRPDGAIEFLRTDYKKKDKAKKPMLIARFDRRVAAVKTYPGMDCRILDFLYKSGCRGIVLEGTGLGHAPVNVSDDFTKRHADFLETVKRITSRGVVVCMVSQCPYGKANMNVYSTGRKLLDAGVIPLAMTPEAAYVKLGWALGHTEDAEDVKKMMMTNYAGEFAERIDPAAFLF